MGNLINKFLLKKRLEIQNRLLVRKINKLGFKFDKELNVFFLKTKNINNYLINVVSKDFNLKEIKKITDKLDKKVSEYILNVNAANPETLTIHYYEFKFVKGEETILTQHEEKIQNGR